MNNGTNSGYIHAILRRFGDDIQAARLKYDAYVAEGLAGGQWESFYQVKEKAFLGSDRFVEEHRPRTNDLGGLRLKAQHRTLDDLSKAACRIFAVSEAELQSRSRKRLLSRARQALCLVAKRLAIATTSELAAYLQRDASVISHF